MCSMTGKAQSAWRPCGNKGPLYLEVDEKAILEIDELQREIDEAEEEARKAREREATGTNTNE